ncbi:MAG: sensor histidine kinase [Bacteroidota bacterium]
MLTLRQALRFNDSSPLVIRHPASIKPAAKPTGLRHLDQFLLYIVVPALGIGIPNVMQLITNNLYRPTALAGHYVFFIFVSFLVWKGNVFWLRNIRSKFIDKRWNYRDTVVSYFLVNVVYSGLVSFSFLYGWVLLSAEPAVPLRSILTSSLIVIICVVFINNVYELFYLHAERTVSENRATASDQARIRAELQVLKGQFDPHFLYNSLNVLSYLITHDQQEAEAYNSKLGMLMQYPLKQKRNDWVLLSDELEFAQRFFELQQIRYGTCMNLHVRFSEPELEHTRMVPPMALQLLVENAMKHNNFSTSDPLHIYVVADKKQVKVWNNKQPKPHGSVLCSGTGLIGLQRRIRLLCNKTVEIKNSEKQFSVTLPLQPAT